MPTLTRCRVLGAGAAVLALAACGPAATPNASRTTPPSTTQESTTSAPATTTAPTPATVPPVGSTLATISNGEVLPNSAGQGFSVLVSNSSGGVDASTVTTYDVAGRQLTTLSASSGFSGSCGAADLTSAGRRIVVGETVTNQPAQGINPAQYSAGLFAFDATTGEKLWTTQLVPPQGQQLSCGSSDGRLSGLQPTTDGVWAAMLMDGGSLAVSDAVDLRSGQLYPKPDLQGALGTQLVTGGGQSTGGSGKLFVFALPPTWQGLGSFSSGRDAGLVSIDGPGSVTTGLFERQGTGAGLSSDGSVLFAAQSTQDSTGHYGTQLTAYSLPAMTQVWRQDTTAQSVRYTLLGSGGTTLVVERQGTDGTTTDGLDARTGAALWTLPKVDQICGLSTTQMLVEANAQTAVIDLATGKQVSYSGPSAGAGSSSCPHVLPGGIAVQGQTVVQALQP